MTLIEKELDKVRNIEGAKSTKTYSSVTLLGVYHVIFFVSSW